MNGFRKTISIENVKSHYQGILPYIPYSDDDNTIQYVVGEDNGNFGNFVCDFGKVCTCLCGDTITYKHTEICTSGITEDDNSIEARLRYCDILSWYNFIQEQLRNGIYGVSTSREIVIQTPINCSSEECVYGCSGNEENETTDEINCFVADESILELKYNFHPLNIDLFKHIGHGIYQLLEIDELDDNVSEEELADAQVVIENADTPIILLPNYNMCMKYESMWVSWWQKWFGNNWGNDLFDNYEEHQYFQFCQDFEKYCLGKINVPETYQLNGDDIDITGILVPESITYTEVGTLRNWFETNDIPDKSEDLQKEWDNRGGDAFYDFINNITPNWIIPAEDEEQEEGVVSCGLSYLVPYISVPITLYNKHDYEGTYENYLDDYQPFSAVGLYSGYSVFENSHFVTLEDSGKVESQLDRFQDEHTVYVNGAKGVWGMFGDDDTMSPIFKCTMRSGYTESDEAETSQSLYAIYNDGRQELLSQDNASYTPPSIVGANIDRIFISKQKVSAITIEETIEEPLEDEIAQGFSAVVETNKSVLYEFVWWECKRLTKDEAQDFKCYDDEIVLPNEDNKYRNIFMLSCIDNVVDSCECGDYFYFLPKIDNGIIAENGGDINGVGFSCFDIPFKNNTFINMTVIDNIDGEDIYIGDYIPPDGIVINNNQCVFNYVVGGRATYDTTTEQFIEIPNTGIRYRETCFISMNEKGYTDIDGFLNVEYFYNNLVREDLKTMVYSDEYRMYRFANQADLVGMEVGTMWTEDNAIIAKLFTKESSNQFLYTPSVKPNVLLERGTATAFESYFKLAECNTFDDLQNYGNNYFNI